MLNAKVCRMEGCRRGRNQLKVSIQSHQLPPSHTGSLKDLGMQEHSLKTVGHTDPQHGVLSTSVHPQ